MARVKGIAISNLEGRIGNVVFRNRQGVNVASQRPASVKNPRTEPQQLQRMYFNTAVQAYSVLKGVADHSFEGYAVGAKTQAKFLKDNLAMVRNLPVSDDSAFVARTNASFVPNAYKVSQGSLTPLSYSLVEISENIPDFANASCGVSLKLNGTLSTYGRFLSDNNLKRGDQISCILVLASSSMWFGNQTYQQPSQTRLVEFRATLSLDAPDSTAIVIADSILNVEVFTDIVMPEGCVYDLSNGALSIRPAQNSDFISLGGAWILSRKTGDNWLRSTQYFLPNTKAMTETKGMTKDVVVRTYNPSDPLFLNNAE